jgi:hypothetical protein
MGAKSGVCQLCDAPCKCRGYVCVARVDQQDLLLLRSIHRYMCILPLDPVLSLAKVLSLVAEPGFVQDSGLGLYFSYCDPCND